MRVIFATDASANQGNSEKAMNSSRSAIHTQKPYREMFVTSTREVLAPRCCDFISTLLDNLSDVAQLVRSNPVIPGHFDRRLHPKLGLTVGRRDVDVHPRLFP